LGLLRTIAEKVAGWRRYKRSISELLLFSDNEFAGYRYWTE